MTRSEFFERLQNGLKRVPPEEAAEAVRYYNEYFDEAGPEKVQQVLEELGPPEKIAQQICAERMVRDIVVEDAPPKAKKKGIYAVWIAVLAVFASPIALPVAVVLAAFALVMVVVVLCILLVPFLIALGLLVGGLFGAGVGFTVLGAHFPTGVYAIGSGLAVSGAGLLGFLPLVWLAEAMFRGIGRLVSRAVTRRKKG